MADGADELELSHEQKAVRRWRRKQAIDAGLSIPEADLFADSDQDVGLLRKLVAAGVAPELIARIVV